MNENDSLYETEFDFVIIGTGMIESILAGILAKANKSILHLDTNEFYGSDDATLNFNDLLTFSNENRLNKNDTYVTLNEENKNDSTIYINTNMNKSFHIISIYEYSKEIVELLKLNSNKFNIDLKTNILLANDKLIELMIHYDIGKYLEFLAIDNISILLSLDTITTNDSFTTNKNMNNNKTHENQIYTIPCSKNDIFVTNLLNIKEKRILMKFIQYVMDYGERNIMKRNIIHINETILGKGRSLKRPQNKADSIIMNDTKEKNVNNPEVFTNFIEMLKKKFKFTDTLKKIILYSILSVSYEINNTENNINDISMDECLEYVYKFVTSIGRFSNNTGYLYPLYGLSEIAQGFCRLCAVYGGIYVLRSPLKKLIIDKKEKKVKRLVMNDLKEIKFKNIIMNKTYLSPILNNCGKNDNGMVLVRGIYITNKSIHSSENKIVLTIPPNTQKYQNKYNIQLLQLDSTSFSCPKDNYIVYAITTINYLNQMEEVEVHKILNKLIIDLLMKETDGIRNVLCPHILWSMVYTQKQMVSNSLNYYNQLALDNMAITNDIDDHLSSLNFSHVYNNAKKIFEKFLPENEFLSKNTEHADVVDDDEEEINLKYAEQSLKNITKISDK